MLVKARKQIISDPGAPCGLRIDMKKEKEKKVLTTKDLEFLLAGTVIKLDCGHQATIGHNFANTVIIYSEGGGKIKTACHNCGY